MVFAPISVIDGLAVVNVLPSFYVDELKMTLCSQKREELPHEILPAARVVGLGSCFLSVHE
jgi:hypothetical protein